MEEGRLPPGQYLTRDLPVYHVGTVPPFMPESWNLRLSGLVRRELDLSWDEFRALPRVELTTDFHCVTTWSRYDLNWGGVLTSELVRKCSLLPEAKYAYIQADGNYTTIVKVEDLMAPTSILADSLDGQPLDPKHGFPARLVIPHLYAWKSAKWVRAIEFTADYRPGFWEARGYAPGGDVASEDRFTGSDPNERHSGV
ncbi:MAG: sulfite oxidase-like oxidoreductase [Planctomycetota bacterium]